MKIALGVIVLGIGAAGVAALQESGPASVDRTRFLFSAVIEGLAEDGFDPAMAGVIAENPKKWFVPECPVCESVLLAFGAYTASCDRWRLKGDPWAGSRVPKATMDALRNADVTVRHKAFEGIIRAYVHRRFDRFKMTEDARDRIEESLKTGMKQGLEYLKKYGEEKFPASCPSCEGAN
jgi:uncharacterized membrane protein